METERKSFLPLIKYRFYICIFKNNNKMRSKWAIMVCGQLDESDIQ